MLLIAIGPANAAATEATSPQSPDRIDALELERLVDDLASEHIATTKTPGLAVAVVTSRRILLEKGYGFADVENRIPVDPLRSVFRVGSISKLITATLIMQLVEEGTLDLDVDIKEYVDDLKIPRAFAQPVTLRHLLAHTAGFEEISTGTRARSLASLKSLGDSLADGIPAQLFAPGTVASYTNFALCLAGYVAESATKVPYDELVERRLLRPLDLRYTTSRQDLPPRIGNNRVVGHAVTGNGAEPRSFDIHEPVPAGGFGSTARDMARFMQMYLGKGSLDSRQILKPDTVAAMWQPQFSNHPAMGSIGLTFWLRSRDGDLVVGHSGRTRWFRAELVLVPDTGVGVFAVTNGTSGRPADVVDAILEEITGKPVAPENGATAIDDDAATPASDVGRYKALRFGRHGPLSLMGLALGFELLPGDTPSSVVWRGETLIAGPQTTYRNAAGKAVIGIDPAHGIADKLLLTAQSPVHPYTPVIWFESPALQATAIASSMLVFGFALLIRPITRWRTRNRGAAAPLSGRLFWPLFVSGLLGLAAIASVVQTGLDYYYFGPDLQTRLTFALPWLALLLIAVAAVQFARSVQRMAVRHVLTTLLLGIAAMIPVAWLIYWNLDGR